MINRNSLREFEGFCCQRNWGLVPSFSRKRGLDLDIWWKRFSVLSLRVIIPVASGCDDPRKRTNPKGGPPGSFNTTTSMDQPPRNMLLWFAQFEREEDVPAASHSCLKRKTAPVTVVLPSGVIQPTLYQYVASCIRPRRHTGKTTSA